MQRKRIEPVAGDVFSIPLFLGDQDQYKYHRMKYDPDEDFAFGRVIEDRQSKADGFLVEVFSQCGTLTGFDHESVAASPRLLQPILITGVQFSKNRWRVVSHDADYDPERDSGYSRIFFYGEMVRDDGLLPVSPINDVGPVRLLLADEVRAEYMSDQWWPPIAVEEMIVKQCDEESDP